MIKEAIVKIVDKQDLKQLLQRLESSIDPDIRTAKDIIQQYDELIQKANQQAEQVTSEANENARRTVDDATMRAQTALAEAQARAADLSRDAADKANAMIADAQARAEQLVAEDAITQRANAEASQLLQRTHMDCDQYRINMENDIQHALQNADGILSQQLDQLRRLRQNFSTRQNEIQDEM